MVYYLDKVLNIAYQPDIMITYAISKSSHITDMIITDMKNKFQQSKMSPTPYANNDRTSKQKEGRIGRGKECKKKATPMLIHFTLLRGIPHLLI
jgi:hypothetical protein